jgi:prolipoprotein diacylglyceryltransferase
LRTGALFAVYVGGYGIGRLWVEALRADAATTIAGLRVNTWMSVILIVGAGTWLVVRGRATPRATD